MFLWLATLTALLHGALVGCVVVGALLAMAGLLRRRPRWERAYYGLLAVVVAANLTWGDCPLTVWEQELRNQAAPGSAYRNSFIGHYLFFVPGSVLSWIGPTLMLGAILAAPLWRWRDRRRSPSRPSGTLAPFGNGEGPTT